jgi:hypothetical protein
MTGTLWDWPAVIETPLWGKIVKSGMLMNAHEVDAG